MRVTLYGRPQCSHCLRARNFMDARGIGYDYIDVETGQGLQMFRTLGVTSVPVLTVATEEIDTEMGIGNEIRKTVIGFNMDRYEVVLGLRAVPEPKPEESSQVEVPAEQTDFIPAIEPKQEPTQELKPEISSEGEQTTEPPKEEEQQDEHSSTNTA
jgi:glutaredoxin